MPRLLRFERRDDETPPDDNHDDHHGLSGWAIFIIVIVVLLAVAAAGWFLWAYWRKRQGASSRNYPAPAPGGVIGWFNGKIRSLKNKRYAAGSYEATGLSGAGSGQRGRRGAPMDPDEAWDTRVGNEADSYGPSGYYEEQELGLHPPNAYSGTGYGGSVTGFGGVNENDRGRSRSRQRELDERYDEETGGAQTTNPFSDDNATSLRGVSPRPIDTHAHAHAHERLGDHEQSQGDSPTERKSMFRENV